MAAEESFWSYVKRRYPPHAWSRPGYPMTLWTTWLIVRASVLRNARTRRRCHVLIVEAFGSERVAAEIMLRRLSGVIAGCGGHALILTRRAQTTKGAATREGSGALCVVAMGYAASSGSNGGSSVCE